VCVESRTTHTSEKRSASVKYSAVAGKGGEGDVGASAAVAADTRSVTSPSSVASCVRTWSWGSCAALWSESRVTSISIRTVSSWDCIRVTRISDEPGRRSATTGNSSISPRRSTAKVYGSPGWIRGPIDWIIGKETRVPLTRTTRSPRRSPARAAGLSG